MAYLCSPAALHAQVRQIARWLRAARQDRDPGIRFLHASYAVANLDMLRQLASDAETAAATGADPVRLHAEASALQDEAQRALEAGGRSLMYVGLGDVGPRMVARHPSGRTALYTEERGWRWQDTMEPLSEVEIAEVRYGTFLVPD
jgi:hypothetical protein